MNKVYIQNLAMIITNNCNLNCAHCLRGCKNSNNMSKEVIEATINQIIAIGNLCICGGEPTLATNVLEYLFEYIIKNKIWLDQVSITINGTIYSLEFLNLLAYISEYIGQFHDKTPAIFTISYDQYHISEIKRLGLLKTYLENIDKYQESPYFYGFRSLNPKIKLFREGNAETLSSKLTIDLRPIDIVTSYTPNGMCCIGPLITVNTEALITEDNSSLEHQKTLYNYGNVFDNSLEEIALTKGRVLSPKKWEKATNRITKKYVSYN